MSSDDEVGKSLEASINIQKFLIPKRTQKATGAGRNENELNGTTLGEEEQPIQKTERMKTRKPKIEKSQSTSHKGIPR